MGCPIRKFSDQSLFAAPRNLSQRTTSFIASQRQGIRRIPLRHLIVLEIRKRTIPNAPLRGAFQPHVEPASADEARLRFPIRKDQFCFKHIRDLCGQAQIATGMLSFPKSTMGLELPPNRASPWGETGYASSSQCQILERDRRAQPKAGISHPARAGLSPSLFEDRRPAGP